jgi:hypothetical protein
VPAYETRSIWAACFQDVTGGTLIDEPDSCRWIGKLECVSGRETEIKEYPLGMSAIVLKAGAIGTAANHVEPIASQAILKFTTTGSNIFKQNASLYSSRANPIQFSSPIGHPIYETGKRVPA